MSIARAVRRMRSAISPRLAISSFRIMRSSHPEDAEAAASLDRPGVRGGERDAQRGAGVAGVEQAVVVEPRGDEEGVRLGVDLRLDRPPAGGGGGGGAWAAIGAPTARGRASSAAASNSRPDAAAAALPTIAITPASWAAPMTASLAPTQAKISRGS